MNLHKGTVKNISKVRF